MKKLALSLGLILCSKAAFADCPAGTVCETGSALSEVSALALSSMPTIL
jgi:hypothetical protein